MFGGNPDTTLSQLSYHKYMESIATHSSLQPELLPLAERAIYFHSLRVHLQVCQWKFLFLDCLDTIKWGWQKDVDTLKPIKTDLQPAPEIILNFIRCKCSSSTTNICGTNKCTCQKNGLAYSAACAGCHGAECSNTKEMDVDKEDENLINDDNFDRNIFDIFN